jgi:DNA replication protein DnaC
MKMQAETMELKHSVGSTWKRNNTIYSNDPEAAMFNPPAPVKCEYCGKIRYTSGIKIFGRVIWAPYGPEPCTCPEAKKDQLNKKKAEEARRQAEKEKEVQERIKRIIGQSGIGTRFMNRTFESFEQTQDNAKAYRAVKAYADNFTAKLPGKSNKVPGRNGLFISGPKGTGKTHLAVAVSNQLMRQGTPVICMTMIDLLERIKQTYNDSGQTAEATILSIYKKVPLLVIDDIGKEQPTEWAISTIYNIINSRYEAYMPLIITTNYDDRQLIKRMTPIDGDNTTADATIDRIREMCGGIIMSGQSWRSR